MDCSIVSAAFPVFKQSSKIWLIQSLIKSKVIYFRLVAFSIVKHFVPKPGNFLCGKKNLFFSIQLFHAHYLLLQPQLWLPSLPAAPLYSNRQRWCCTGQPPEITLLELSVRLFLRLLLGCCSTQGHHSLCGRFCIKQAAFGLKATAFLSISLTLARCLGSDVSSL